MPNTKEIEFPTTAHARKFRHILGQMSRARVQDDGKQVITYLRPVNLFAFERRIHANGMRYCEAANDVIKFLAVNPDESVQIVAERRTQ